MVIGIEIPVSKDVLGKVFFFKIETMKRGKTFMVNGFDGIKDMGLVFRRQFPEQFFCISDPLRGRKLVERNNRRYRVRVRDGHLLLYVVGRG